MFDNLDADEPLQALKFAAWGGDGDSGGGDGSTVDAGGPSGSRGDGDSNDGE